MKNILFIAILFVGCKDKKQVNNSTIKLTRISMVHIDSGIYDGDKVFKIINLFEDSTIIYVSTDSFCIRVKGNELFVKRYTPDTVFIYKNNISFIHDTIYKTKIVSHTVKTENIRDIYIDQR